MSYRLVIEGASGTRRVRRGALPRRGEWLNLEVEERLMWLPVLEVVHVLSEEARIEDPEDGCEFLCEQSDAIVFSSISLSVDASAEREDDLYRLLLPPTRWPAGGRIGGTGCPGTPG